MARMSAGDTESDLKIKVDHYDCTIVNILSSEHVF